MVAESSVTIGSARIPIAIISAKTGLTCTAWPWLRPRASHQRLSLSRVAPKPTAASPRLVARPTASSRRSGAAGGASAAGIEALVDSREDLEHPVQPGQLEHAQRGRVRGGQREAGAGLLGLLECLDQARDPRAVDVVDAGEIDQHAALAAHLLEQDLARLRRVLEVDLAEEGDHRAPALLAHRVLHDPAVFSRASFLTILNRFPGPEGGLPISV